MSQLPEDVWPYGLCRETGNREYWMNDKMLYVMAYFPAYVICIRNPCVLCKFLINSSLELRSWICLSTCTYASSPGYVYSTPGTGWPVLTSTVGYTPAMYDLRYARWRGYASLARESWELLIFLRRNSTMNCDLTSGTWPSEHSEIWTLLSCRHQSYGSRRSTYPPICMNEYECVVWMQCDNLVRRMNDNKCWILFKLKPVFPVYWYLVIVYRESAETQNRKRDNMGARPGFSGSL